MAYIGNSPANVGNYQIIDDISGSFDGSQTSFALASGGASMTPTKSSQLIVNISGVVQQPDDSATHGFLVNSNNIVFSSAPLAADTFWGVYQGQSVDIGTPSDDVVDTIHIKDGAITGAKIAAGTVVASDIADDAVTEAKLANSINTAIAANTAKTGITSSQASAITANTAKTGITSSQATAITAALPKAGGTVTGNILHNDNIKNIYGAGTDANIYSDGQNLIIEGHNADSEVQITSDDRVIIGSKGWGESFAIFNDDGAVSLYYDSNVKFATTSDGAAVTGNLTATGNITAGNNGSLFLLDNAGQKSGQIQTDSSAANALQIDADPDNSASGSYIGFRIDNSEKVRITDAGKLGIGTANPSQRLHVKSSGYGSWPVYVERSANSAQLAGIYESSSGDGGHGMLYIKDGSGNTDVKLSTNGDSWLNGGNVGIGTASPDTTLNVAGYIRGEAGSTPKLQLKRTGNAAGNGYIECLGSDDSVDYKIAFAQTAGTMSFSTAAADAMNINSSGNVGIGHTSPPSQLTIQGGVEYRTAPAPGSGTLDIRDTGAEGGAGPVGNHGGGIVLGVTAGKGFCGIKAGLGDGGGNTAGHMKFYTRGATGDTHMSERMRIEYNGRVQINGVQASPASGGNLVVESNSGNGAAMTLVGDSNATAGFGNKVVALNFSAKNYLAYNNPGIWGQIRAENGNGSYSDRGQLVFSTGYGGSTINDHMILYSEGHLTLGHASNAAASQGSSSELTFYNNGNFYTISNNSRISASSERQTFRSAGTQVGAISAGGSSTSYGTSSDYRLKENVVDMVDATTRLKQLKPKRFNWIADDTNTLVDGFIAHEAADVVPDSVFGIKDAMAPETYYVDGDELPAGKAIGDIKTYSSSEIKPQQLDQSKLVPLLVKTIQELEARLTAGGL